MLRKLIPIAVLALFVFHIGAARADQVLRVFTVDDLSPKTRTTQETGILMRPTPIYGGSDRSAFHLQWVPAGRWTKSEIHLDIPIFEFDGPASALPGDRLEGLVLGCSDEQMSLSDGSASASTISLPTVDRQDVSAKFQPFHIALPLASASRHLVLSMKVHQFYGDFVFADLRIVRTAAATTASAPAMSQSESLLVLTGLREEVVRGFSGNDFDPALAVEHAAEDRNAIAVQPIASVLQLTGGNGSAKVSVLASPAQPPRIIPILAMDDPGVTSSDYAIAGDITYSGVQGDSEIEGYGCLEMESDFADGTSAFTRALADSGPMRIIKGRSGLRSFLLPYHCTDKRPSRIRMNLAMSGRGNVEMTSLRLVQYVKPTPAIASVSPRSYSPLFNPRFFWIAVTILPLVTLIALLEPLIRRGRGRLVVMSWIWVWFAAGQICFAWGMAALGHGEPLRQVGPMLLASALVWMAMLFASRRMNRRYRDVELKRMQLMDIV